VSFVRNEAAVQSEVHIFDAQNFADGPVCKLVLPCRVPEGFHATWARGDLLAAQ
jgi:carotenoid cleavage dioxygenase